MSFSITNEQNAHYIVCTECHKVIYTAATPITYVQGNYLYEEHKAMRHTRALSTRGVWNVVCMHPEGAQIISCEEREIADAAARAHRTVHPDIEVRVMFDPEGEF